MIARQSTVVLFDWNGTVVLDTDRARASLNTVLTRRSLPPLNTEGFRREFHLPMRDMFERLGADDVSTAEVEWNDEMAASTTIGREGGANLRALAHRGIRLGVVSAAFASSVLADMNFLGLDGIWDSIDAPAPDKLAVLQARRGTEARAYYIGDTVYDMRCAIEAGYVPLAVDRGYTSTEILTDAGAAAALTTFDDLVTLLTVNQPGLGIARHQ